MNNFVKLLKSRSIFFKAITIIITAGFLYLTLAGKDAALIPLNTYHPFWANVFFINYTFMGDGMFAICLVAILFFFKKNQEGLALLYGFAIAGITVQVIKNLIASSHPKIFLEEGQSLFFVNDLSFSDSGFPSGHTAIAFAMVTVLIMLTKNSMRQFLLLTGALLIGFSRIYLAQHFLSDILGGAIIGELSGLIAVRILYNTKRQKLSFNKINVPTHVSTIASFN